MREALVTNPNTRGQRVMDAEDFEKQIAGSALLGYKGNPKFSKIVILSDVDTGNPVDFRSTYKRNGNEEYVRAHFAFSANCSPTPSASKSHTSIKSAVLGGAKILLSVNLDTSYRQLNFRPMKEDNALAIEKWKAKHKGNYLSVSVKTAQDAVRVIQQVNELGANVDDVICASYRGAVLPYRQFYLGRREQDIINLYNDLSDNYAGVPAIDEPRFIGFPRIMRFVINHSTLKTEASQNVHDSDITSPNGKKMLMGLGLPHLPEGVGAEKNAFLSNLWDHIASCQGEFYVLACPSVTTGHNADKSDWQSMRWKIVEPEAQMRGVVDHPHPKFTPKQFGRLEAA